MRLKSPILHVARPNLCSQDVHDVKMPCLDGVCCQESRRSSASGERNPASPINVQLLDTARVLPSQNSQFITNHLPNIAGASALDSPKACSLNDCQLRNSLLLGPSSPSVTVKDLTVCRPSVGQTVFGKHFKHRRQHRHHVDVFLLKNIRCV